MKIELKKISYNERLSEETPAYAAQVWVDGVHLCDVSNSGHGGCDMQRPAKGKRHDDIAAINGRIKAEYPPHVYKSGNEDIKLTRTLELVCHELLYDHQDRKRFGRKLSKNLTLLAGGKVYSCEGQPAAPVRAKVISDFKAKHPSAVVLNDIPLVEAWELVKAADAAAFKH